MVKNMTIDEKLEKLQALVEELDLNTDEQPLGDNNRLSHILICEGIVFRSANGTHWGSSNGFSLLENDNWVAETDIAGNHYICQGNHPSGAIKGLKQKIENLPREFDNRIDELKEEVKILEKKRQEVVDISAKFL